MTATQQAAVIRAHLGRPTCAGQHPQLVHRHESVGHYQLISAISASTSSRANVIREEQ